MAKLNEAQKRRVAERDALFGDSPFDRMWRSGREKIGFFCPPRVLPVLMLIAKDKTLVGGKNCGPVYLELLALDWGEGFVRIIDEEAHAFRCGFSNSRGLRSWRERMRKLEEIGFIEIARHSAREIGYVLMVHPNKIVERLRAEGKLQEEHWLAYNEICREFKIPPPMDPLDPKNRSLFHGPSDDDIPF